MSEPLVVPLRELGRLDLALAGGKAANLGELIAQGFPVPDGFVVTTAGYALAVRYVGLETGVSQRAGTAEGAAEVRSILESATIPDGIERAVRDNYGRLGAGPVAVRSSATAEDLPGAAFAGQQETFLNVIGDEALLDAVRHCWASLWSDRALAYRRKRGVDEAGVRMAVVVQKMVEAESAGVMFTANPLSGDRSECVIEANPGLGEAVVSGAVTPERYVVSGGGNLIDWTPGRSEVVIRGSEGGGVSHESPPEGKSSTDRLLSDEIVAELVLLGDGVADHFARPQDIEWALAEGRVWLLQARPMTALPPPPLRLGRRQRLLGSVLHEYLPVRPYPIDVSTWLAHGPAAMMGKITSSFGIRGAFENFLVEEDGVVVRFVPPTPRPTPVLLSAPFRLLSKARRYEPSRWTEDPRFRQFLDRAAGLYALDLEAMPWRRLIGMPREALALLEPITQLRMDYLPRAGLSLLRLALALWLLGEGGRLGVLLTGAPTRTADANRALESLAARVRSEPELARAFAELEPPVLLARLPDHPGFGAEFQAFIAEFGHRESSTPALVTPPTWADEPETVLSLIRVLAASAREQGRSPGGEPALEALLRKPLVQRLGLRRPLQRWVSAAREGLAFREDSHFYMTRPLPVLRRAILELGRRLARAGVLAAPEEVFHLRLEELEAIEEVAGGSDARVADLRGKVRARSAKREELAGVPLIDSRSLFPPRADRGDALVTGTPAAGGLVSGPVRVIRGPSEFGKLERADILVCPYTNPSWTPLFQRAAAVVVDSGGVGSHAAIVAREYGIPAIMGTGNGTSLLVDGQLVTVNGDGGRVTQGSGTT